MYWTNHFFIYARFLKQPKEEAYKLLEISNAQYKFILDRPNIINIEDIIGLFNNLKLTQTSTNQIKNN